MRKLAKNFYSKFLFVLSNILLFSQWTKSYIYNCRTMCIHIFQTYLSNIITTYLHFFQMISIPCLQNISIFTDCFQIIISQINNKYKSLWKLLHVHWRKVFIKFILLIDSSFPLDLRVSCISFSLSSFSFPFPLLHLVQFLYNASINLLKITTNTGDHSLCRFYSYIYSKADYFVS